MRITTHRGTNTNRVTYYTYVLCEQYIPVLHERRHYIWDVVRLNRASITSELCESDIDNFDREWMVRVNINFTTSTL